MTYTFLIYDLDKMSAIIGIFLFCVILSPGSAVDGEDKLVAHSHANSPLVFPNKSAPWTPILIGDNPNQSKLPPKVFPNTPSTLDPTGLPILSGDVDDITEIKKNHEIKINATHDEKTVSASVETKGSSSKYSEQEDMLHSKYTGGHDVDELLKPDDTKVIEKDEKKPTEKDEKKVNKKDPKSEVDVHPSFDSKGPKMMNETKSKGESMLASTSKMMAMSSSVLSTAQAKHHGFIEPAKTAGTVLLSVVVVVCLGLIGLLIWKRIAMRRFGRDILINEDDFDEVSDMHTFERTQIQIT